MECISRLKIIFYMLKKQNIIIVNNHIIKNKKIEYYQKFQKKKFTSLYYKKLKSKKICYGYFYKNINNFYKNISKNNIIRKKITNIEKKINKGLVIIPLGGLGEIGMNCMLLGIDNRFILIDAGILFSDLDTIGVKKIIPDINFLAFFKDKIESIVITHGHEDHIGALEWIIPILDQNIIIFSPRLVFNILKKRFLNQNNSIILNFVIFKIKTEFILGPFICQAFRVTHSIPDCCGLVFKSYLGNLLHTGDWKIDEYPLDGEQLDKSFLEYLSKEKILLMMSDSTNAMTSGRTDSEKTIQNSIVKKILYGNNNKRIIATQFASNLFRLNSIKKAAELSRRKIGFIGISLHSYLEAALMSGKAPFHPSELVSYEDLGKIEPSKLIIVTTGSQGEKNSTLNLSSLGISSRLKLDSNDTVIYSAKIIPGNDKRVVRMLNRISNYGCKIIYGSMEKLHTSGHGYIEELKELIRIVKPVYFLPIHGEILSLYAHSQLALKECGVKGTINLRNGQILIIENILESMAAWNIVNIKGEINIKSFFCGEYLIGSYENASLKERIRISKDGILIIVIDFSRKTNTNNIVTINSTIRITSKGIWIDRGILYKILKKVLYNILKKFNPNSSIVTIEQIMRKSIEYTFFKLNYSLPNIIITLNEFRI
ncbi:myb domain-containing regulator of transcription (nucleomorph) [Lotharella oceanica]|uniref:Myb domain-containing regulator of transcription n=1 Tax=Lotharella oceanica TaxID=641309 RepID=A0A060DAC3_9EUKA|nr:myb domain-containing regulator of transcription [Lotharella oceanica]|mmetsp:Transcript_4461/g.8938  ORF Transcript_4461/g.8938 Transcript_4461/m.8938 type:complete len:655 (-) Transcript_4461:3772-5736(-)